MLDRESSEKLKYSEQSREAGGKVDVSMTNNEEEEDDEGEEGEEGKRYKKAQKKKQNKKSTTQEKEKGRN